MPERLPCGCSRRDFLRRGLYGIGVAAGLPTVLGRTSAALALEELQSGVSDASRRILVVVELSGGNDGLNTVVPFGNDEYYRVRPNLSIRPERVIGLTEEAGFHPSLTGMERLYKEGRMAVVEGCGYPNPSLSHFSSMGFWHTGVPNGGEALGWLGRFADDHGPDGTPNYIVNVARSQALAVRSARHSPSSSTIRGACGVRVRRGRSGRSPSSAAMRRAATTPSTSCAARPRTPLRAPLWCATPGPATGRRSTTASAGWAPIYARLRR